ncbi:uracil-DNA glycosylase [Bacilli bacterium PM5-3]|nr:uracil-DNA glycosylase [Bacilli bacterium PM5-3]MDH6603383.1 uracil-DNA glycosylase [Bacilli bacterium PM5-9]
MDTNNDFEIINDIEKQLLKDIDQSWYSFLKKERNKEYYHNLIEKLTSSYQKTNIYPDLYDILKPMKIISKAEVKVVIIGQDPYHTPLVADGLAFSSKQNKIPPSLKNIFKEIKSDLNIVNESPDLTSWAKQGVFLINSVLSVEENKAKSHHKLGWSDFVINLIKDLDKNIQLIFVLWGNDAQKYEKYLNNAIVIKGVHPSPLARGGFFGGKYFSKINDILKQQNKLPIDWRTY